MEILNLLTGIQHVGIPTKDIKRTIEFYERLGFNVALATQNGQQSVAFMQLKNLVMEFYEGDASNIQNGAIDHFAIDVKDIDKVFAFVKNRVLRAFVIGVTDRIQKSCRNEAMRLYLC